MVISRFYQGRLGLHWLTTVIEWGVSSIGNLKVRNRLPRFLETFMDFMEMLVESSSLRDTWGVR